MRSMLGAMARGGSTGFLFDFIARIPAVTACGTMLVLISSCASGTSPAPRLPTTHIPRQDAGRWEARELSSLIHRGVRFDGQSLSSCSLRGADLSRGKFIRVFCERTDLAGAVLTGAVLHGGYFWECCFREADLTDCMAQGAILLKVDMRRARVRCVDLSGSCINGDLCGVDLSFSNLTGATLDGLSWGPFPSALSTRGHPARLSGAILYCAKLRNAHLGDVDLCNADLREADLRQADLRGSNLMGADLTGAKLEGTKLQGALCTDTTVWPRGFDAQRRGLQVVRLRSRPEVARRTSY